MAAVTISVALQKGGVGKSTTVQALASNLGAMGKKVLLIDMDSQGNVTYSSGIDKPGKSITDVLGGDCSPEEAVIKCKYYDLLAADEYLTNVERAEVEPTLLRDAIAPLRGLYDFIVIDTPPALGNLSFMALVASDYVIIPVDPRPFALQGLGALNATIQTVCSKLNSHLSVLGILFVKYSPRTILNRDIYDMAADYSKQMNTSVFKTTIREGIAVAEAQAMRVPLIEYAKKSKPSEDYVAFTREVLERLGK